MIAIVSLQVVAYSNGGGMLVGAAARRQAVINPENTYASVKRVIGRGIDDVIADGGVGRLTYGAGSAPPPLKRAPAASHAAWRSSPCLRACSGDGSAVAQALQQEALTETLSPSPAR